MKKLFSLLSLFPLLALGQTAFKNLPPISTIHGTDLLMLDQIATYPSPSPTTPTPGVVSVSQLVTFIGSVGSGTVTSVSVATVNGFSGSVTSPTTTPGINLSVTAAGVLKGSSGAISPALAADIYALWSGTCSSTTFLRGDGACQTPPGVTFNGQTVALGASGNVNSGASQYSVALNGAAGAAIGGLIPGSTGTYCFDWTSLAANPTLVTCPGAGGGLTSVGLSTTASWLTVGSSPLTSNGTITLNPTTAQTANEFVATPNGSAGAVGLRAIVAADIPTLNQNTTGTAANLSGTPALPNGTTATTQTTGDNTTKIATDAFVIANAAGVSSVAAGQGIAVTGTGGGPYTGAVTISSTAPNRTVTTSPTVLATDMGGQVNLNVSGGGTMTIPAISSTVFPAGATLTVVNYSASTAAVSTTPAVNAGGGCVSGTGIPAGDTWNITSNGTTLDCNQTVSASSGGSSAFSAITSGTNSTAAMIVGTGSSLAINTGLSLVNTVNSYTQTSTGLSITSGTTGVGRNLGVTVNDASAVDGIAELVNVTCTTCTFPSYIIDYRVGGSSIYAIDTTGDTVQQGNANSNNSNVSGTVSAARFATIGTTFTIASGTGACATRTTLAGGAVAGHFTCTGTTGTSTVTLTLPAATTAYVCYGRDVTTPTVVTQTGAESTTSVTLSLTAVVANDVISFGCPISY